VDRRQVLRLLAGAGLVPLLGCGTANMLGGGAGTAGGAAGSGGSAATQAGAAAAADSCSKIPDETAGPYPGDGSNGPNALTASGIVRSDIRSSFAGMTGTAAGVPLTLKLKLVDVNASCASLGGYAIYLWHCDRDGNYSLYTVSNQNYLRGVQETDDNGVATFTSIFPGCYSGRWPHVHFEIFQGLDPATAAGNKVKVSQLALPETICKSVYATTGYSTSVTNLAQTSLTSDMVFGDGYMTQVPVVTGSVADGYVAALTVGIAA